MFFQYNILFKYFIIAFVFSLVTYVVECLFGYNGYFVRYPVWDGMEYSRFYTFSSRHENVGWEDCPALPDSMNGLPARHVWLLPMTNFWGQKYQHCCACKRVKATKPTKSIFGFIK